MDSNKKQQFYDKKIYVIGNYIWTFFFGNLYFIITSILFFITIIAYGSVILSEGFLYMYISSLTLGPSIGALIGVMYKLINEKELRTTSQYFSGYISNFKQSFLLWTIIDTLIFYILFDIKLVGIIGESRMILMIFLFIIALLLAIAIYGFMIIIRFNMKMIDIIKLAVVLTIKNVRVTIVNVLLLGTALIILNRFVFLWTICLFTIISYFIVSNTKFVITEIEKESGKIKRVI